MSIVTPLSVQGRFIVDANGVRVKLAGVNWAGAHQDHLVPGGLDKLHRDEIAQRLAGWGFNSVRLPFALGTLVRNDGTPKTGPADGSYLSANPDLAGLTPWGVYQAVAGSLTAAGLMVIPNVHLLFPGWCCSDADNNGLWYNDNWPSSTFTGAWLMVARQFASNPLVIGYDLKNEPRPATVGGVKLTPSWGDGNGRTDFRQLYSDTATQLQAVSGGKLFFCEGLGYAGDLTGYGAAPVTPDTPGTVVPSMHDYSWFGHPSGQSQADYTAQMTRNGGYLLTENTAPVWIGEVGTANTSRSAFEPDAERGSSSPSSAAQGHWFGNFLGWAKDLDVDWCWWHLDATMSRGTEPVTNKLIFADGDLADYGLLAGQDWQGSSAELIAVLQQIMPATTGPGIS